MECKPLLAHDRMTIPLNPVGSEFGRSCSPKCGNVNGDRRERQGREGRCRKWRETYSALPLSRPCGVSGQAPTLRQLTPKFKRFEQPRRRSLGDQDRRRTFGRSKVQVVGRLRIDGRICETASTIRSRRGPHFRVEPRKRTPTSFCRRQTTSQLATSPSSSMTSSKVSGMAIEPSVRSLTPVFEMSRTTQTTLQCRSLNAATADLRTR
jgi:hypothetical protein